MNNAQNIELFNKLALIVFERLYASFPVPATLSTIEIASSAGADASVESYTYDQIEPVVETISFLKEEEFLDFSDFYQDGTAFLRARLTMKGLTVLNQIPDSLERKETMISRIRGVLAGGAKEAGSEAVKQIVGQVFQSALTLGPTAIMAAARQ